MKDNEVELRLQQIRSGLLSRQAKLAAHVSNRTEPLPADFSEQAVELENDEAMTRLLEQVQLELNEVHIALERLSAGSYTFCSICGKEIEEARLIALPTTSTCVNCAVDKEQTES